MLYGRIVNLDKIKHFKLFVWRNSLFISVAFLCDCYSTSDVTLLAGIIVLEEFCKEMAAMAFLKHCSSLTDAC